MDAPRSQVIIPETLAELFQVWGRFPDAVPFAGGVSLMRSRAAAETPQLPRNILSLERVEELRRITRTERYLELGAMVRLADAAALGKAVPPALSKTLERVGNPQARNLATIGGAICGPWRPGAGGGADAAAALSALDARYELRTAGQSRWVSASRFSTLAPAAGVEDAGPLAPQELLTRIRVPLDEWNWNDYRKLEGAGEEGGGVLVCVAKIEKDVLVALRAVFSGGAGAEAPAVLRDRGSETFLEGRKIPLERKDVQRYRELWEERLAGPEAPGAAFFRERLAGSIEAAVSGLAD